jgi:hypothetical protein
MSAPSFSSFPPSFSSFPDLDLDPSPSRPASVPPKSWRSGEDEKKKRVSHKNKLDKLDKGKDKNKKRKRDHNTEAINLDDEKLKAAEDTKRRDGDDFHNIFYSDRKGDHLNVRYGGLHAGDVPKYHLVGRMSIHTHVSDL